MNLPLEFIETIQGAFKGEGRAWLNRLPELVARASQLWGLTDIHPVPNLSYNFVAFAKQGARDVVLKIGVPNRELNSEAAALALLDGRGACSLFGWDEKQGLLLLERLRPGRMLVERDDDERTVIAAELMQKIWRDPPDDGRFIRLSDWFDGLKKIRPHFGGSTGVFPASLLEGVEASLPELLKDGNVKLLHGDFHHFNILYSARGWLAIDPKGVIGPVGYETAPLMMNPRGELSSLTEMKKRGERRAEILSERLNLPRGRILRWAAAHALLSAWWSVEEGAGWEYALQCAEIFFALAN